MNPFSARYTTRILPQIFNRVISATSQESSKTSQTSSGASWGKGALGVVGAGVAVWACGDSKDQKGIRKDFLGLNGGGLWALGRVGRCESAPINKRAPITPYLTENADESLDILSKKIIKRCGTFDKTHIFWIDFEPIHIDGEKIQLSGNIYIPFLAKSPSTEKGEPLEEGNSASSTYLIGLKLHQETARALTYKEIHKFNDIIRTLYPSQNGIQELRVFQ